MVPQFKQVNMAGHNATLQYGETTTERTARLHADAVGVMAINVPALLVATIDAPIFVTTVSGRRA
jgi:hypothetical protein